MESELISSQLSLAYATSAAIEFFKNQKWFPMLDKETQTLNRLVAIAASFVVAIGIHWTFDAAEGTLVIGGLTVANIWHGLLAWIQQYAFQQGAFRLLIKEK